MKPTRQTLTGALLASTAILMPAYATAQDTGPTITTDETIAVIGEFVPDERRTTSEISNILDAESLARTQDSDIADALSRVTGLSLDEGRFIIVRGLNERYSRATLNGSPLPSNEPLRNVVPLDVFPTSILDGVLVQKTYSPQFNADFGGGLLELRTVAVPSERIFEIGGSLGFNTETTFTDGYTYAGDGYDWTGTDDITDFREFPGFGPNTLPNDNLNNPGTLNAQELELAGEDLLNNWSVQRLESTPPDWGVNVVYGDGWELGGEAELGFITVVDFGNSWQTKDGVRRQVLDGELDVEYAPDQSESTNAEGCRESADLGFDCGFFETVQSIDLNALVSVGLVIDNNNEIKVTSSILRKTTKEALLQTGYANNTDFAGGLDEIEQRVRTDWIERQTWFNQLAGDHAFEILPEDKGFLPTIVNWRASYSEATRTVQNRKEFTYILEDRFSTPVYRLDGRAQNSNFTEYSDLEDETYEVGLDVNQPFEVFGMDWELKFGGVYTDQERNSNLRQFQFQPVSGGPGFTDFELREQIPEIIYGRFNVGPDGFQLEETTTASDAFNAASEIYAGYAGLDVQVTETLRIAAGFRYEDSEQETNSFARGAVFCFDVSDGTAVEDLCEGQSPGFQLFQEGDDISTTLTGEFLLPAVTATWEFYPNMQVRGGFSQTINRPTLRELSTSPFLDPDRDVDVEGFPFLQIAEINNFDIRWEWYLDGGEILVAAFYKDIDNPIEVSGTRSGLELNRTFRNGESAELYGIEAEIFYNLDFQDWFEWDWLGDREFYVNANFTFTDSEVTIGASARNVVTNDVRELQGQSKYLGNLQLGWQDFDRGERAAILFNYTGERIDAVGTLGRGDQIETPPILLDFVYSREFDLFPESFMEGLYEVKFAARNLLGDEYTLEQDGFVIEEYEVGRTFTIGLTAKY